MAKYLSRDHGTNEGLLFQRFAKQQTVEKSMFFAGEIRCVRGWVTSEKLLEIVARISKYIANISWYKSR